MNENPNTESSESQRGKILHHLMKGNSITQEEARKRFGCARLGARIHELKQLGNQIESTTIKVETRNGFAHVASYSIPDESKS